MLLKIEFAKHEQNIAGTQFHLKVVTFLKHVLCFVVESI